MGAQVPTADQACRRTENLQFSAASDVVDICFAVVHNDHAAHGDTRCCLRDADNCGMYFPPANGEALAEPAAADEEAVEEEAAVAPAPAADDAGDAGGDE